MKLAVTGADRPMGAMLCRRLTGDHEIFPVGEADESGHDLGRAGGYHRADLNLPPEAAAAIRGAHTIVHAQPHDPAIGDGPGADGLLLEKISRGTYVLVQAAVEAHVGRIILISQIRLFDAVTERYTVNAHWQPRPRPEAESLAPYLAELVCREIARVGRIESVNLRMGELDAGDGTSADDAVDAVQKALTLDIAATGYHWHEQHVVSGGRFAPRGGE